MKLLKLFKSGWAWFIAAFIAFGVVLFFMGVYGMIRDMLTSTNMLFVGGAIIILGIVGGYIKRKDIPRLFTK